LNKNKKARISYEILATNIKLVVVKKTKGSQKHPVHCEYKVAVKAYLYSIIMRVEKSTKKAMRPAHTPMIRVANHRWTIKELKY
jgi:hypothetical protein